MDDFGGRAGVALVTGGSGGLGAAVCRLLATRGSDVVLSYRSERDARAGGRRRRHRARPPRAHAVSVDLVDDAAARAFVDRTAEEFGGVHTLVHAAGPTVPQLHLSKVTPSQFRDAVDQEVGGFFAVAQPALPHLRAAAALAPGRGSGNLVAVTTAATERFPVRDGLSSGPKAAIESLVRALAAEEGRFGVRRQLRRPGDAHRRHGRAAHGVRRPRRRRARGDHAQHPAARVRERRRHRRGGLLPRLRPGRTSSPA